MTIFQTISFSALTVMFSVPTSFVTARPKLIGMTENLAFLTEIFVCFPLQMQILTPSQNNRKSLKIMIK